jgi:hypothetical protein
MFSESALCPQSRHSLSDLTLILLANAANGSNAPLVTNAAQHTNGRY